MRKNTIRRWYAVLVLLAILMSVVVVGALGIYTLWGKTNRDVVTVMNLTTQSEAAGMDLVLLKTKDAVDTVAAYVSARVTSIYKGNGNADEEGLDEEIRELFLSAVENMEGVVGYSVLFDEPFDGLVDGFRFHRHQEGSGFYPVSGDDDNEWYGTAKAESRPLWVPIRECPYMDGYIFSYAVPIIIDGLPVGVACVDVDFEVLAKPVRELSLYGNGYAYLTDDRGTVLYHPLIGYGTLLTEDDEDVPEVDSALADTSNHGQLITYKYKGQIKKMAFQSLINEMRLVVTANQEDTEREAKALIRNVILSAAGITVLFMYIALAMEKRTMHPALDKMDSLAHLDGLTGIQNKTSFMEMQSILNQKIREGKAAFGFVMFDANNLKGINDKYGHRMGDAYLIGTVEMIQDCFPGRQAYRIGGDEFVVLLDGEEAVKTAAGCLELAYVWQKKRREEKREPWEKPSVAGAFAEFDPAVHRSAEEVLSEADSQMYQKKQEMREQTEIR